ncbi:MAG: type II secretion system protein [Gemmataceae bacterium]|nr:type II secretion system protein [Gemmataceae bacterium]
MTMKQRNQLRRAFTMAEIVVAIAILFGAMVTFAQIATWCLGERARNNAALNALHLAENILEEARAQPTEKLDAAWAAAVQEPARYKALPPACLIEVKFETPTTLAGFKKVEVKVKWKAGPETSLREIVLTGFFAPRTALVGGPKP